jgi:hypothetical protein
MVPRTTRIKEFTMSIKLTGPLLAAGIIAGTLAVVPAANLTTVMLADTPISAETGAPAGDDRNGTDPLVPFGTDPQVPVRQGYVDSNHDEIDTSNGVVDLPF